MAPPSEILEVAGNSAPLWVVSVLLTIIGFFLMGLIKQVKDNNVALHEVSTKLALLAQNLITTQADTTRAILGLEKSIDRQEKTIELSRHRIHYLMNKLTAVKMKLDQHGIHMSEDWAPDTLPDDVS